MSGSNGTNATLDRGLPSSLEAERLVLGSIMLNSELYVQVAAAINPDDFSLESHRRIFKRAGEINDRGERIDRITVFHELKRYQEADSCGGLTYLHSLDDGLPNILNIDSYVRIVQDKALLRRLVFASQHLMNRCLIAEEDTAEILAGAERTLQMLGEKRAAANWLQPGQIVEQYPGGLNGFINRARGGDGIPTPWSCITEDLCGLHKGDLFVVAGRPSHGKSIVMMQMAHHAASREHGAAVISLEMSKESLVTRLACCISRVDSQKVRAGYLTPEERYRLHAALSSIADLPLFVDDSRLRTVPAIMAGLRRLIARHPISLVLVDHVQLMQSIGRGQNRHAELSEVTHGLKDIAGDMNVTVVLLSQLNRDCEREKRAPQLSDLKETGTLEEDADVVMFVHRPEMYHRDDEELRGKAEFIIAKQRDGKIGKRQMVFLKEIQKFEMAASQFGAPEDESPHGL